jgi:hypothetical protein
VKNLEPMVRWGCVGLRQAATKQKRLRRQNRKRRMLGREDHHSGEFNTEGTENTEKRRREDLRN